MTYKNVIFLLSLVRISDEVGVYMVEAHLWINESRFYGNFTSIIPDTACLMVFKGFWSLETVKNECWSKLLVLVCFCLFGGHSCLWSVLISGFEPQDHSLGGVQWSICCIRNRTLVGSAQVKWLTWCTIYLLSWSKSLWEVNKVK